MIEIADTMDVRVIYTELSGNPNQPEICNGMLFRSLDELMPYFEPL